MKNLPIGQILVESGFISNAQLEEALAKQKTMPGNKIGDILIQMGFVSETQFTQALAMRLKVPFVDLTNVKISIDAVKKIPEALAKKNDAIAISISNNRLNVATNDPINFYVFEEFKVISGMEIHAMLATKTAIRSAIDKCYAVQNVNNAMDDVNRELDMSATSLEESLSGERIDNAPVVKLVNTIVETAYKMKASDIHIEPFASKTRIRYRVDGELFEQMSISNAVHNSLVTRLKIIGGMNIAEKRIPQDGRFGMTFGGETLDVRVSSLPTVYGEKIVIRLLATSVETTRRITDLGMTDYNYSMFKKMIQSPHGVILVTGPTGSGKTTTLYATLSEIAKPNINVITVEDPVEKKLDGINQVQINAKAGLTFSAGLRSILRQDPDVVMVGEIRDGETAEIAIRAAITGHLVLSTLHTNDAASTIIRLVDMGVPAYLVGSSLIGVVAQRLVRLLCPKCKKLVVTTPADMKLLGINQPLQICTHKPGGCPECSSTGFKGRSAIHEIIICTNDIRELISRGGTSEQIAALARQNGTRLLRDNVAGLVVKGVTTMDELIRATYSV